MFLNKNGIFYSGVLYGVRCMMASPSKLFWLLLEAKYSNSK